MSCFIASKQVEPRVVSKYELSVFRLMQYKLHNKDKGIINRINPSFRIDLINFSPINDHSK